jgi:hypothetical protein
MWFRHPPPPDRRAVAMQMVERRAELAPETRTITVDGTGVAKAPAPPAMTPLDFTVTYTVAEYAGVLREHIVFEARRRRRKGPPRTSWQRVGQPLFGLALIAPGIYWFDLMPPTALAALMAVLLALMAGEAILPLLVTLLAPLVYFARQRPAGATRFSVDAAGFTRTSRLGAFGQTWDQVREVHAYPGADVLVLGRHWIPIPRRCLDRPQSNLLRAYLAAWRAGRA